MTFTVLMKATSTSPVMIEIMRLRDGVLDSLGLTGVRIETLRGQPQLGLSSSLDMLEDLRQGDLLQITQTEAGPESLLRSSSWRLLRLEGHLLTQRATVCLLQGPQPTLGCNAETGLTTGNVIRIDRSGLYELSVSGVTFQVSILG